MRKQPEREQLERETKEGGNHRCAMGGLQTKAGASHKRYAGRHQRLLLGNLKLLRPAFKPAYKEVC